jgi:uncharacterized membrane protein YfcA
MRIDPLHAVVFILLGSVFGFFGGLFGIGGATLAIPTLGIVFGMTEQVAQGTALIMALPNVVVGLWRYAQKARLDVKTAVLLAGVALPFTYAGALFATSLASRPLRIGFAIFLIVVALDIGRRALYKGDPVVRAALPWPFAGVAGGVCGVFSGVFGIGGAIILVPAMTLLFDYSQLAAQGMSLAFSLATATVTAITYASKSDVDWPIAIPLAVGGVFAVRFGVDLAHRLPERGLRLAFVVFVVGIGIALLIKG